SVPFWLFFELINLRIENWYYVFVPDVRAAAWTGISLSFATVLPAVLLASTAAAEFLPLTQVRWRPITVTPSLLRGLTRAGVAMLVLPILWPAVFFPLVWGAITLLVEPMNYRRDPARSLLADLAAGRPGRMLALLAGGALVGFLWELYNVSALGKWIYTVPFFDELKLFEMPVLGFVGFPVFALECFAVVQSLVLAGLTRDVPQATPPAAEAAATARADGPGAAWAWRAAAIGGAAAFTVAMLAALERHTIVSTTPRLLDLPAVPAVDAERLLARGVGSPFELARLEPQSAADLVPGVEPNQAQEWIAAARLATFRGLGTEVTRALWHLRIRSIEALAATEPVELATCLARAGGIESNLRRVRVWVDSARKAVASVPDEAVRLQC
ncbi:MAG: helix-hairpin-helix domain-containing protein, partial [Gemmatimonadetes bacterium]|nr:helix-hairpin-helix domain-containing protein [Gemmatimonadota bacterium]